METTDQAVDRIRTYFDENVDTEWTRLADTVSGRVSFEVHRRFLEPFIREGMNVLEVGAGPGRFTRVLADLGALITVSDISQLQLEANQLQAERSGFANRVTGWLQVDVRDTSMFRAGQFDAVVAYGGPLSYTFDHVDDALRGLLRITAEGGVVVASVMSLLGAWRHFLPAVLELPDEVNKHILETGDLRRSQPDGHVCQLYRSQDIARLVERCGANILQMSASNWASLDYEDELLNLERNESRWRAFVDQEVGACGQPGALDGGTHLIFACQPGYEGSSPEG